MAPRLRLLALAAAISLVVACSGRDPLAPSDVSGLWLSAWPQTTQITNAPDTLVLDGRGGGGIRSRVWLDPIQEGQPPRELWASSSVTWQIQRDDVFFRWCLQVPGEPAVRCPDGPPQLAGRLRADGMLWIGPTSMASSMSALPWRRAAR